MGRREPDLADVIVTAMDAVANTADEPGELLPEHLDGALPEDWRRPDSPPQDSRRPEAVARVRPRAAPRAPSEPRPAERPALQAHPPPKGPWRFMSTAQEAAQSTEITVDATDVAGLVVTAAVTRSEDVEQEGGYTF